jgi:hypothetical protein
LDTKDILVAALRAVREAEIPESLQPTALSKAIDLITGVNTRTPEGRAATDRTESRAPASAGSMMDGLVNRLKLTPEIVGEVFHESDGQLHLSVAPKSISGASAKAATEEIAVLVAAARQASGDEEFTASDEIRKVASDFGKLNEGNFARYIGDMTNEFQFSGKGASRKVKLKRVGWARATELVNRLGGGEV